MRPAGVTPGREVQEEFAIAGRPDERRSGTGQRTSRPSAMAACSHAIHGSGLDRRVAHDALGHLAWLGLELRLDQAHDRAAGNQLVDDAGQDAGERDEGDVDDGQADPLRQGDGLGIGRVQPAGMGPLHGDHPGIRPQRLGELSAAHVESIDAARAPLQQTVGEAAGRGTDVEADPAAAVDRERIERPGELLPAARHEARRGQPLERDRRIDHLAGLAVAAGAVAGADADVAGKEHRLGPGTRRGQAAVEDELVEADAAQPGVGPRPGAAVRVRLRRGRRPSPAPRGSGARCRRRRARRGVGGRRPIRDRRTVPPPGR